MGPVLLLGQTRFANVDIRIRVKGGGFTAQIYAIRQAIAKSLVAYYQKYVDEASKTEIRDILMQYDRTLWSPIPEGASRRSSAVPVLARATRSRTASLYGVTSVSQ